MESNVYGSYFDYYNNQRVDRVLSEIYLSGTWLKLPIDDKANNCCDNCIQKMIDDKMIKYIGE